MPLLQPICKLYWTQQRVHFYVPEFFSHLLFLNTRKNPFKLSSIGKPVVFFRMRLKRHHLARNPWQTLANLSTWQHKLNWNPTVLTIALRSLQVRTRWCFITVSVYSVKYNKRLHLTLKRWKGWAEIKAHFYTLGSNVSFNQITRLYGYNIIKFYMARLFIT